MGEESTLVDGAFVVVFVILLVESVAIRGVLIRERIIFPFIVVGIRSTFLFDHERLARTHLHAVLLDGDRGGVAETAGDPHLHVHIPPSMMMIVHGAGVAVAHPDVCIDVHGPLGVRTSPTLKPAVGAAGILTLSDVFGERSAPEGRVPVNGLATEQLPRRG